MTRSASFPIPVLGSRDDVHGSMPVEQCSVNFDEHSVNIEIRMSLENDGILEKIKSGAAAFAIRISCSRTFLRKTWRSDSPSFSLQLHRNDVSDLIKIYPFVVAVDPFDNYRPSDLNPDYGDDLFSVRPGQILAIGEPQSALIETGFDPLRNLDASIIKIGTADDVTGPFLIDFDRDQILMHVDNESLTKYKSLYTRVPHTMMMSMVLPVVAETIRVMQNTEEAYDSYGQRKWYQRLSQILDARPNIDLSTASPLTIAQELLDSPHMRGLDELDHELTWEGEE